MKNTILAPLVTLILAPVVHAQGCVGDIAVDGSVDGGDLGVMLANWGDVTPAVTSHASDMDDNGHVDGADLGSMLANWGTCPAGTWCTVIDAQPDPAVVTDQNLRAAIEASGYPWRIWDRNTKIELLLVPPGTFQMGCIMGSNQYECYPHEKPEHQVTLTNAFYLGRFEVTQAQWMSIMGSNPSFFQSVSAQVPAAQISNRPVERVSWIAVRSYRWRTGVRLPTEAEWEYACRAGTQTPFYNGSTDDNTLGALAWYSLNSGNQTRPVGGKAANALGFYDMLGNVGEWVNDVYGDYTSDPQTNPPGPVDSGSFVRRGGSWTDGSPGNAVRASNRDPVSGSNSIATLGFRVARDP